MLERTNFMNRMTELNAGGVIKACFIRGSVSRDVESRVMEELLNHFGITAPTTILVDTGSVHWGILYKPEESAIFVDVRKDNKLLKFTF